VPVLSGWAAFGLVGLVGWYWIGHDLLLPYRLGGFALGIPILIVLGALAIGNVGRAAAFRIAGMVLAAIAAGTLVLVGFDVWTGVRSKVRGPLFGQLSTVASYASTLSSDTAIVLVGEQLSVDVLRAGLPTPLFDRVELVRPEVVQVVPDLGRTDSFVILTLEALIKGRSRLGGQELGRGVAVLRGPVAEVTLGSAARAPRPGRLTMLTFACLLVLVVVGLGWSLAFTELPIVGAITLAPAFGLVAVGLLGLVADRSGAQLLGAQAVGVVVLVAGLGWAAAAAIRLKRGRTAVVTGDSPA
jgi:hypothetical protein